MGIVFEKGRSVVSESYWDPGSEHRFNHGDLEVNWVIFVNTTFQKWWETSLGLLADEHNFTFIVFALIFSPALRFYVWDIYTWRR